MPRARHPDLEPEILLPDDRRQKQLANDAVEDGWTVPRVRLYGKSPINDGFIPIMDEKQRQLREIKLNGGKLDEGLVAFMMENCAKTLKALVHDKNGNPLIKDGCLVFRLIRVGCRIYMTQQEIALQYGCSRQHVTNQIKQMKEHSLIVNCRNGWYEFAAVLCWCGDLDVQAAYRHQQIVRDGRVITDGTNTLVTEDMDSEDNGGEEHTLPQEGNKEGEE
jgi:hypothetical protein